jgi:hypothetical protein
MDRRGVDALGRLMTLRGRRVGRRIVIACGVVVMFVLLVIGFSLVSAWRTPGNEDFKAKWADWLRAHDMSFVVDPMEQWYYSHDQPPKGGRPRRLNAVPRPSAVENHRGLAAATRHLRPPQPVPLLVEPSLPGEGQWVGTGPTIDGGPGVYVSQFRADQVYSGEITSAVWMDPTRVRINLVPGAREPGGAWPQPPFIAPTDLARAIGAFNGGFRFQDAHGGFYLDGRAAVPLQPGAASIVLYHDGHVGLGLWGREVTMTPQVDAVLQNLVLIVDGGQVAPNATYNDHRIWGHTLGATTVIARSGIGVTADGALIYVAGPALTARSLAEALQRAGAVRAMALDLNPEWVTFNLFGHPNPADAAVITGTKLYPQIQRSPSRYLPPIRESRDFFEVLAP